jgi:hypothetical protein
MENYKVNGLYDADGNKVAIENTIKEKLANGLLSNPVLSEVDYSDNPLR